jgi:hypothetical protein
MHPLHSTRAVPPKSSSKSQFCDLEDESQNDEVNNNGHGGRKSVSRELNAEPQGEESKSWCSNGIRSGVHMEQVLSRC